MNDKPLKPRCKICKSPYHYRTFCNRAERKPIEKRGKEAKQWDKFRDTVARPHLDRRDGLQCVDCGKMPPKREDGSYKRHDIDHVKGKGAHPELQWDVKNMVYRCRTCHTAKTGVPQWTKKKAPTE